MRIALHFISRSGTKTSLRMMTSLACECGSWEKGHCSSISSFCTSGAWGSLYNSISSSPYFRCSVNLTSLPRDVTLDFKKPLLDREDEEVGEGAYIHFNLAITASKVDPGQEGDESTNQRQEAINSYVRQLSLPPSSISPALSLYRVCSGH